nr:transposase [Roseovarius sp. EL26]
MSCAPIPFPRGWAQGYGGVGWIAAPALAHLKRDPAVPGRVTRYFWGRHFWGRGYFSIANGAITENVVLQYLERHIKNPIDASR